MIQRNNKLLRLLFGLSILALSALVIQSNGTVQADSGSKSGAVKRTIRLLQAPEAIVVEGEQVALRIRLDISALESLSARAPVFGKKVIVPFPISETESLELELERFSLTGPQTRIVVADQSGQREIEIPRIATGIFLLRAIFGMHAAFQICAVGPNWNVGVPTQMQPLV